MKVEGATLQKKRVASRWSLVASQPQRRLVTSDQRLATSDSLLTALKLLIFIPTR